jgi:uncharacterized protein (TIGR00251 family)
VTDKLKQRCRWLAIRVTPNAGRNEITGWHGDVLQIKIAAPPEKGKANQELIDFLGRTLGVKKSAIAIIKGQTSRNKAIEIAGVSREEIIEKLKEKGV